MTDEGSQLPAVIESGELNGDRDLAERDDGRALARVPWSIQAIWVALGAYGFVDNVFGSAGASFPWHPTASSTALAWLAFGMVGLVVNHLDKLGLPGVNMSFRKLERAEKAAAEREISADALRAVLADYSDLMQNWAQSVNLFAEELEKYGKTDDDVADILARYCLGRMEEARDLIAERGDRTRLSFWWFMDDTGGLKLLFSDDIRDTATLNHVFRPGSGLLGQCYVECRTYNLEDGPSSIYYEAIRPDSDYHGLLLVPVRCKTDESPIGVLSIDREKKEAFDDNAENVGSALSDLIAYAMETALCYPADTGSP
jgi:GAF domain